MSDDYDYFNESVPDGISNAVNALFPDANFSGQDAYELLTDTFGDDVDGAAFKAFTAQDCAKMAENLRSHLELEQAVPAEQGRKVIEWALRQWGG